MNALTAMAPAMLSEAGAPVFLMSVAKPLVTFLAFVPYAAVVSGKLEKDAAYFNLKPQKWAFTFLGFGTAALLAALLIPTWIAGFPVMLGLMVAPCVWYMKFRNKALEGTKAKPLTFLSIDFGKMAAERRAKAAQAGASVRFQKKDRSEHPVPDRKDPAFEVYAGIEQMLTSALDSRANRIEIALSKQGAQVQHVIDAVRFKRDPIAGELATRLVDSLKGYAGLEAAERRKFQRGNLAILRNGDRIVLTVTSVGSMQGESVRVDVEREKQLTVPLDKTGMTEQQSKLVADTLTTEPRGVVLVGARPGQGLTTLAYSLLGRHDSLTSNVKTLERRFERIVEGVEHADFDPAKSDYATQLQTIVRRGPDVVFVAEAGEPGIGKVLCAPGARGSLFYLALPSDSVPDMLAAWAKASGDPAAAAETLRMAVAQRLIRKLCTVCRAPYAPNPAEQKMLAIPAGKQVQIYKQSGKVLVKEQPVDCPTCKGTGFLGATAAVEVLVLDDEARRLLAGGDVKGAYLQARRAFKTPSLQDAALIKVRAGETSFDEVKRVFAPPAAAPAAAKPAAAAPAAAKPATPAPKKP
jgi:type II secretory ATPase GspE/PulE/Tfp pilus assembly ATPase PilB-like protein